MAFRPVGDISRAKLKRYRGLVVLDRNEAMNRNQIAEPEWMVGRLTMELAKRASRLFRHDDLRRAQLCEDMHKRIHSSLGYLTPVKFESQWRSAQVQILNVHGELSKSYPTLREARQSPLSKFHPTNPPRPRILRILRYR